MGLYQKPGLHNGYEVWIDDQTNAAYYKNPATGEWRGSSPTGASVAAAAPTNYVPPGTPTMQPQPIDSGRRQPMVESPWPWSGGMPSSGGGFDAPGKRYDDPRGGQFTPLPGMYLDPKQSPWPWGQQPSRPMGNRVARPWQVNPAVWDSLGSTGQQLSLSFAEDEGWDANDYERQINATRPIGFAPRSVQTQFAAPRSRYR